MRLMSSLQLKRALFIDLIWLKRLITAKMATANCYTYKNRDWSVISYIWLKSARFGSPELTDVAP